MVKLLYLRISVNSIFTEFVYARGTIFENKSKQNVLYSMLKKGSKMKRINPSINIIVCEVLADREISAGT